MRSGRWILFLLALSACVAVRDDLGTARAPSEVWTPPVGARPAVALTPPNPFPVNFRPGMPISLAEVIDLALTNHPATRLAWLEARAAQARMGAAAASYWPEVNLGAQIVETRSGQSAARSNFGPSLALNYLLFDFGGRAAGAEAARQTLIASNFLHNQAIQDVILLTQQAYYSYLDSRALLMAEEATIKERQTSLEAAEARHSAGVATIADVLQARTARSQAELNRESLAGNVRTIEGVLATVMGLPATTRFDFGELPREIPSARVEEEVGALLERAVTQRPDLAAARASAAGAAVRIEEVRSQFLPSVGLTSSLGHTWFTEGGGSASPHSVGVAVRWPLFTGMRNVYDVRTAEVQALSARETVRAIEEQINLQVWTSYYALQTASQRLTTSRDLLNSAQQSVDVARSRYQAGVGGILDLLTAESALENARAQEVQARGDWFLAVAQLAHDTGSLEPAR